MKSIMDRIRESGKVFVFGIGGDSGSGKTTISRGIKRILGEDRFAPSLWTTTTAWTAGREQSAP